MNARMLSLLQLVPGEAEAVTLLTQFAAAHPGVTIVTPHYRDEPWRAEIATGTVPGEGPRTSRVVGADWPSQLLGMLVVMFADTDFPPGSQARPGGNQPGDPSG